jgi:uncharacterized membrane protein
VNIQTFLYLYLFSIPVFILFDLLWLGVVAKDFYQTRLSHLLGDVNWVAAVVFYLLFSAGLTFFATYDAVITGVWQRAAIYGALFGFFTYMTYDLTNLATLREWSLSVVWVDIIWGTILGAIVSSATYFLYNFLN